MAPPLDVLILNGREVEELLDLDALLEALGDAFRALTLGDVTAAPRNQLALPGGEFLLSMPGRTGDGPLTVKVVTLFEGTELPAHLATIGLYDARTGACRAFMDGTYITAVRTSAAAALACDLLARGDVRTLALVGGGVQASHHLRTFPRVREFEEIRVASSVLADAERVAAGHPRARAVASVDEAIAGADVVALATNAGSPVVELEALAPGTHVSSVGYHPPDGELSRAIAHAGHLFVECKAALEPAPVGCAELSEVDASAATELGELLLGRAPGRRDDEEITVYKAMGHVAEDIAAAELVFAAAQAAGAGTRVAL